MASGRRFLFAVTVAFALGSAEGQAPAKTATHGGAPAVSPDGSRIAFLSDRDGATDVYVIGADGKGETRLTRTPEAESQPEWSGDGGSIWFTVFVSGSSRIYAIPSGGGDPKPIGSVPGRALRLSPDGKRVLYWTGTWTAMKLFVSDLDGSGARQLTDGSGVVWGARWSPDGKRIAFGDNDPSRVLQVHVMNADGSGRRQVTRFAPADGSAQMPAWSADGAQLAVQSGAKGIPAHVWIVKAATGSAQKLGAHTEPYVDEVPAWFPNGKHIAFQSDRSGAMEIWVMGSDGTAPRQVTR
jgi:Tol biopolymer transport system component